MSAGPNRPCPYLGEPSVTEELWQVVLQLDHAYDSLRAINTYHSANHHKVSHPPSNSANKLLNQTGQSASMDKQNNLHYSKFNNNKNNNKPPMWTNRLPRVNEYKKPAAPTANSSYKRDDKGPNALKPPFHPAVNANYQNCPSADKTGNPICYQCGKIGYTNECPNHLQWTRVFAMGLTEVDNAPAETQDEPVNGLVEESPDINNDDNVIEEVDKEQLVDDLYEEDPDVGQFSTLRFTDIDDELNCNADFGSMTFIDPTNDNYTLKLALAQRAEKLLSQEEIVAELVDNPVLKFKAEGQLTKKSGPKPKVPGAKIAPKVTLVFDMKFRISQDAGKYPVEQSADL